ncbi:MAG TPA: HD domain-containing phosphohydrolase [Polyangiaceae bacterium]
MPLSVAFRDVVRTISLALDMDEHGKLNHGMRVAVLSHRVGLVLGLEEAGPLFYAGMLHDLGALGLEDHIVHHLARGHDTAEVCMHAERGAHIVRPIAVLRPYESMIRDHHERLDGRGFPAGKRGAEISMGASIVHMADLIDRAIRTAPGDTRGAIERVVARERGHGVPASVADAMASLLGDRDLLRALTNDDALDVMVGSLCPPTPGLENATRTELINQLLWVLARVVDAKHSHTMGHSTRVSQLAYHMASAYGEVNAADATWAGLLHDVGKIGLPRRLLDKAGPLSSDEWPLVRAHASGSEQIIHTIRGLSHLALPAASHHERYDGKGYPRGLDAENIPLIGRLLAYADIYDALTSERSYHAPMPHAEALAHMQTIVGKALDPHLADAAFHTLKRWGPAGAGRGTPPPFGRFFESDDADVDAAFGMTSGGGTSFLAPPKGVMLPSLNAWERIVVGADLTLKEGTDALRELTGEPAGEELADHFDVESTSALRGTVLKLAPRKSFTRYVYTKSAKPIEVVAMRLDDETEGDLVLLCRNAEQKQHSMERLVLFYRNFLSNSEAVLFADASGSIIDVNQAFCRMFGYERMAVIGQPTRLLKSGRQSTEVYAGLWESITDPARGTWSGEVIDRKRNGEELDVRLSIQAVRDPNGACVGYLAHLVDISEKMKMEAELRLRHRELQRVNEELVRLGRFKDDLIAMTSHDLRGPLTAIVNVADLMREGLPRMPQQRLASLLDRIRETASKLTVFVSDLLDVEKTESGSLQLNPCRVQLGALLAQCVDRARSAASSKRVSFELRIQDGLPPLLADAARLEQVFMNLLGNASKFTPDGSTVTVRAAVDARRDLLVVHIDDQGPGIPEHAVEAIFDRFYQVKTAGSMTARGFGTGLGLNIVRNLVKLHGGEVRAENLRSGGCRFCVELPWRRDDPRLARASVVVLAGLTSSTQNLLRTLEEVDATPLWIENASRLRHTCQLTDADLVLYDDALADPEARQFLEERAARPDLLPFSVRLVDDGDVLEGRALASPVLHAELRELLSEAALRRRAGRAS